MADGTINFDTKINTAPLKDQIKSIESEIKQLNKDLASLEKERQIKLKFTKENSDRYEQEKVLYGSKGSEFTAQYEATLDAITRIEDEQGVVNTEITNANVDLETAKQKLADLNDELSKTTSLGGKDAKKLTSGLVKQFNSLGSILKSRIKRKLISSLMSGISNAFTELLSYSPALKESYNSLMNTLSQLGGSFVSAFEPIMTSVIPIIVKLLDYVNIAVTALSKLMAVLSGRNYINKAIKGQKDYASAVGKSAKSLQSFDEINNLDSSSSSSSSSGVEYEKVQLAETEIESIKSMIETLLPLIGAVATALLLWKLNPLLGLGLKDIIAIAVAVGGAIAFVQGAIDAFSNGLTESNVSEMILGLVACFSGLLLVCGPVVAGIALLVGGITLLVASLMDWINKGELTNEALWAMVAGILAIGGAIALFVGGWIPLVIAGVVALVAIIVAKFDVIKEKASEILATIKQWFIDTINSLIAGVEGFVNRFIDGINTLIDALNSIHFEIPDWVPAIGGKSFGLSIPHIDHKTIPRLATGTNYVPQDMLAMIHQGEAVVPKEFNPSAFYGTNMAEELTLLSQINYQLERLNAKDTDIQLDGESVARKVNQKIEEMNFRNGNRVFAVVR